MVIHVSRIICFFNSLVRPRRSIPLQVSAVHVNIILTKTTAAQNEVVLSYHRVCGLYFLAVVFEATIGNKHFYITEFCCSFFSITFSYFL